MGELDVFLSSRDQRIFHLSLRSFWKLHLSFCHFLIIGIYFFSGFHTRTYFFQIIMMILYIYKIEKLLIRFSTIQIVIIIFQKKHHRESWNKFNYVRKTKVIVVQKRRIAVFHFLLRLFYIKTRKAFRFAHKRPHLFLLWFLKFRFIVREGFEIFIHWTENDQLRKHHKKICILTTHLNVAAHNGQISY